MEYISSEEFLKQQEEVQRIFIDWWKPEIGDMVYADGIDSGECIILGYVENDRYFTINLTDFYKSVHTKNDISPMFTEGQLRKFIEDKTGLPCQLNHIWIDKKIEYEVISYYSKKYTENVSYLHVKHKSDILENVLLAYWQVAYKIASEIVEQEEISNLIQERQKNDDGTRYTTEDIKRLRNQRSE